MSHLSPQASHARWQLAVSFASRQHRHQLRKDGRTPYIAHPLRVALTVRHHFACDDEVALLSSILHDTIEDTTTDYEDIESKFGEAVANCVACLTKNMALPEHQRESQYDAQLAHGPWQARLVKLADAFDNLCDLDSLITPDRERVTRDSFERARRALTLCELDTGETFERARAALIALLDQLR